MWCPCVLLQQRTDVWDPNTQLLIYTTALRVTTAWIEAVIRMNHNHYGTHSIWKWQISFYSNDQQPKEIQKKLQLPSVQKQKYSRSAIVENCGYFHFIPLRDSATTLPPLWQVSIQVQLSTQCKQQEQKQYCSYSYLEWKHFIFFQPSSKSNLVLWVHT